MNHLTTLARETGFSTIFVEGEKEDAGTVAFPDNLVMNKFRLEILIIIFKLTLFSFDLFVIVFPD